MAKAWHEIRDPIHVFVRLTSDERRVLDSRPFQRLRYIHQLATTYLIYPGATHRRFEHSLGVMELAGRAYDVVTRPENVVEEVRELLPDIMEGFKLEYWRRAVRMAALCHDLGHLPFSHAAERELLPEGWDHERLTAAIIRSDEMRPVWQGMKLEPDDVVKLALGPAKVPELEFSTWETILAELIVGDAFGVDRMDYLLRDSHHIGVAYGRFDHFRLIDTLRILTSPASGQDQYGAAEDEQETAVRPALGVEEGGIQSAEGLMLARYFMYSQVYFHPVRRIYDIHLKDFLKEWLTDGRFSTDVEPGLRLTDNEVTAALLTATDDAGQHGHEAAGRLMQRKHFKVLYQRSPSDVAVNPEAGRAVYNAVASEFGSEKFRHDRYTQRGGAPDFPVRLRDGQIVSSLAVSDALGTLPVVSIDYVFADPAILKSAAQWLRANHDKIIQPGEDQDDG